MSEAINYSRDEIPLDQELLALEALCDYLVARGKYKDRRAALADAEERVAFLEKADIYSDDPRMATATPERKKIHALIAAHHLHGVLQANGGTLPAADAEPVEPVPVGQPAAPPEAEPRPAQPSRPLTEVFSSIELDLRTGLEREQIIAKLQDSGLSAENAAEAYAFVRRQKQKRQRTRLVAAVSLTVLIVILYFIAR